MVDAVVVAAVVALSLSGQPLDRAQPRDSGDHGGRTGLGLSCVLPRLGPAALACELSFREPPKPEVPRIYLLGNRVNKDNLLPGRHRARLLFLYCLGLPYLASLVLPTFLCQYFH